MTIYLDKILDKILDKNPFDVFPQLTTIWPEVFNLNMQESYIDDLKDSNEFQELDFGNLFYIKKNENIIGITGYFIVYDDNTVKPYCADLDTLYLRWHGIIAEERRNGYSEQALTLLLKDATEKYPHLQKIIELVPQIEYGIHIEKHFDYLGFKKDGEIEKYYWSEYLWQPYSLDTKEYLNLNNHSPQNTRIKIRK